MGIEVAYAMSDHTSGPPCPQRGYFRRGRATPYKPEQMRRRESTEYGLLAARENGGQVGGFGARRAMADPVHAVVHAMEDAARDPSIQAAAADPGVHQLGAGNYPVLPGGDPRDFLMS